MGRQKVPETRCAAGYGGDRERCSEREKETKGNCIDLDSLGYSHGNMHA